MAKNDIIFLRDDFTDSSSSEFISVIVPLEAGDLIVGLSDGAEGITPQRLAKGTSGQFLKTNSSGLLEWAAIGGEAPHDQNTDIGTEESAWFLNYGGAAGTQLEMEWNDSDTLTFKNNAVVESLVSIVCKDIDAEILSIHSLNTTGNITALGILEAASASIVGNLTVGGEFSVDSDVIILGDASAESECSIETTYFNATSHFLELNYANDSNYGGGIKYTGSGGVAEISYSTATRAPGVIGRWTSNLDFNVVADKGYLVSGALVLDGNTLGTNVVNSSLTKVGTITNGTWRGSKVEVNYGGTNLNLSTLLTNPNKLLCSQNSGGGNLELRSIAAQIGSGLSWEHGTGTLTLNSTIVSDTYKVNALTNSSTPKYLTDVIEVESNSGLAKIEHTSSGGEDFDRIQLTISPSNMYVDTTVNKTDSNIMFTDMSAGTPRAQLINIQNLFTSYIVGAKPTASTTGVKGDIVLGDGSTEDDYLYVCTKTGTGAAAKWKKITLSTL